MHYGAALSPTALCGLKLPAAACAILLGSVGPHRRWSKGSTLPPALSSASKELAAATAARRELPTFPTTRQLGFMMKTAFMGVSSYLFPGERALYADAALVLLLLGAVLVLSAVDFCVPQQRALL